MNERTQKFQRTKDCKHSVVYKPIGLAKDEPEIASSIYINRTVLGQPVPDVIAITARASAEPLNDLGSIAS